MNLGFKEAKKEKGCFSKEQINIYTLLKINFNNGSPIDVEFYQIKDDNDFKDFENLDLKLISFIFESHFEDCFNCRSYFGNLVDWFSLKEEKFREYFFSKVNNKLAEEFMQMRLNFFPQHIGFDNPNNLKRYLECSLYSGSNRVKNGSFEDHILNCGFCNKYQNIGFKAELWKIHR
ncbi:hypothetical protein HY498_04605 [Candidatus Woesearchaeota archaeon]|nr:hypothetical protein [Candidatus Woesearchaeota archaeon]